MTAKVIFMVPRQITPKVIEQAKSQKVIQMPTRQMLRKVA